MIIWIKAGHTVKFRTYASTCITFSRFHIDLRETERTMVVINCPVMSVYAVFSSASFDCLSNYTTSSPAIILGSTVRNSVPFFTVR